MSHKRRLFKQQLFLVVVFRLRICLSPPRRTSCATPHPMARHLCKTHTHTQNTRAMPLCASWRSTLVRVASHALKLLRCHATRRIKRLRRHAPRLSTSCTPSYQEVADFAFGLLNTVGNSVPTPAKSTYDHSSCRGVRTRRGHPSGWREVGAKNPAHRRSAFSAQLPIRL